MSKSGISSFSAFLGVVLFCAAASAQLLLGAGDGRKPGGGGGGGSTVLAFDAVSAKGTYVTNASSLTLAHPVDSGNVGNPYLMVFVATYSASLVTTSTVTYNSVSCTKLDAVTDTIESNNQEYSEWSCVAPTQGTHNIVATFSATADFSTMDAGSWTGADQTTPVDAHGMAGDDASNHTSVSPAITVGVAGCWLVGGAFVRPQLGGTTLISGGAGTTLRDNTNVDLGIFDSNGTVGTGAGQSMTYLLSAGDFGRWVGYSIVSIKHA